MLHCRNVNFDADDWTYYVKSNRSLKKMVSSLFSWDRPVIVFWHANRIPYMFLSNECKVVPVIAPHLGSIHICGAVNIGLGDHWHHWEQNFLDWLNRRPPFWAFLVAQRIITRWMQNGYTNPAIRVNIGVEDFGREPHCGRVQRVILGEDEPSNENSILKHGAFWTWKLSVFKVSLKSRMTKASTLPVIAASHSK